MPHYFFDIKDGHRLVDPSGSNWKNDIAAIEQAKVLAIGVSLDKPAVDPMRRISVLNAYKVEISTVPVYSKPAYLDACDLSGYANCACSFHCMSDLIPPVLGPLQHAIDALRLHAQALG
jgi:hypothetical protein